MRIAGFATLSIAAVAALLLTPARSVAQLEFEVDPITFALDGFSFHAAVVTGESRFSIGTSGLDMPEAIHGNENWSARLRGTGVKWDYLGTERTGFFAGGGASFMRANYELEAAADTVQRNILRLGVRGGYRQPIGWSGLYVSPWVGMRYNFDGEDVAIGNEAFRRRAITLLPTIHIGWRF